MVETATPRSSDSSACVGCVSQQPIWRHELLVLCSIMLIYAHRSGSWKKLATIRKNYEYIIRGFLKRIDSQVPFPSFHRQAWRFAAPRGPGVTCRREHHMRTSPMNHQRFHHGVTGVRREKLHHIRDHTLAKLMEKGVGSEKHSVIRLAKVKM